MNRFTLFALRLVACVLVLAASAIVAIVYGLVNSSPREGFKIALGGLAFAWAVSPDSEELRAFVGLMSADD